MPFCAQNVTTLPAINSTANSTDDGKRDVPSVFPQESNETKIMITSTIQDTLHLNNLTNSSNLDPAKVEPIATNANISETVYLNKTEVKSNITNIGATNDNLSVNITDVKSNSSVYETYIQNKTDIPVDISTTNVSDEANIKKTDLPVQANVTASNSSKIDTEVPDLLNSSVNCLSPNQIPESPPNVTLNATQQIDRDIELIEDGQNTEDILRNSSSYEDKLSRAGVPLIQGQLAAILAGVFVIISVTAYVSLLSWRRYLE